MLESVNLKLLEEAAAAASERRGQNPISDFIF
jgi:hypothetical protein